VFVPGDTRSHAAQIFNGLLDKETQVLASISSESADCGFRRRASIRNGWKILRHSESASPYLAHGSSVRPQVRVRLAELRASIPNRYPIRIYPDITTHSRKCQYPVPDGTWLTQ